MKLTAKEVISIWGEKLQGFPWDEELIDRVIDSFDYAPSIDSVLYRTADVMSGATKINGKEVHVSAQSSITELNISPELYERCTAAGVVTIEDINKDRCAFAMKFEDYAELTAAMIEVVK